MSMKIANEFDYTPTPLFEKESGAHDNRDNKLEVESIPIRNIETKGQCIRENKDDDHVIELASSITKHGLLEPIVVERTGHDTYQLIAGFHRLEACIRIGWEKIPANIRNHTEGTPIKSLALVENICRKGMTLTEEVEAVATLHDNDNKSPSQICQLIGKSRAWVDRRLALPNLDEEVAGACFAGLISLGMAETLSTIEDQGVRRQILNEAVYSRRTVSQVKDLIKLYKETPSMDEAVSKGVDTIKEQQVTQEHTKQCAACRTDRPFYKLANIWVCADGCKEKSNHPPADQQTVLKE